VFVAGVMVRRLADKPSEWVPEFFGGSRGPGCLHDHTHLSSKGKAIPLQAWTGLDDSRRARLPDFKIIVT